MSEAGKRSPSNVNRTQIACPFCKNDLLVNDYGRYKTLSAKDKAKYEEYQKLIRVVDIEAEELDRLSKLSCFPDTERMYLNNIAVRLRAAIEVMK